METKVPTVYPAFEPNQILTSTHLNQLREYLDEENRLTRVRLSGFGIVCGLEIAFDSATKQLTVKKGYGISTDGYLLELAKDTTYTHFKKYTDPFTPKYDFGKTNNTNLATIEELLPAAATGSKPVTDLENISDKVAVLFYEFNDIELKSCTGSNCDNKGKKREMTPRVLLLRYDAVAVNNNENLLSASGELSRLNIARLSNALDKDSNKTLADITTHTDLAKYYTAIINDHKAKLASAINTAYSKYAAILGLSGKDKAAALTALSTVDASTPAVQYIYDHLKDLTEAYNEFAEAAYEFRKNCFPALNEFPRHLLLGKLEMLSTTYYDEYRSYFIDAPLLPVQDRALVKAQMLFHKLLVLISNFNVDLVDSTLKITPSRHYPLPVSERSLPYYYNPDQATVLKFWSPVHTMRKNQTEILSYHAGTYSADPFITDPLSYSVDEYPLLRIEGFLGQSVSAVEKKLSDERKKYNLAFDILPLKVENSGTGLTVNYDCGFEDLQLLYCSVRGELVTFLKHMKEKINAAVTHYSKLYATAMRLDFSTLKSLIDTACTHLPYAVSSFRFDTFIVEYKKLVQETIRLKVLAENHIKDLTEQYFHIESNTACIAFVNDLSQLSLMLAPLLDKCTWVELSVIAATASWRAAEQLKLKTFSHYAGLHPGMEHIAGVKPGGTFVLVYSERDVFSNSNANPVVADFALPYSCCKDTCQPVTQVIEIPPVAMPHYHEATTGAAFTQPFIVLENDFNLADLSAVAPGGLTVRIFQEVTKGSFALTTNSSRQKVVTYTYSTVGDPAIELCRYEILNGSQLLDSATIVVNIRKQLVPKPLARFDVASTMENKKVNIPALLNDVPAGATPVLVTSSGAAISGTQLRTDKGNIVNLRGSSDPYFEFDPSGSGNISETQVDSFTYRITTSGVSSDDVKVTVYILPCCGSKLVFTLPNDRFCKSGPAVPFTISGGDADLADLKVEGPGVEFNSGENRYYFKPSSKEVTTEEVSFKLMHEEVALGEITVKVFPIASFTYKARREDGKIIVAFKNTSTGGDVYRWKVGTQTSTEMSPEFTLVPADLTKTGILIAALTVMDSKDKCRDTEEKKIPVSLSGKEGAGLLDNTTKNVLDTAKRDIFKDAAYKKSMAEITLFSETMIKKGVSGAVINESEISKSADIAHRVYENFSKASLTAETRKAAAELFLDQSLVTLALLYKSGTDITKGSDLEMKIARIEKYLGLLVDKKMLNKTSLSDFKITVEAIAQDTTQPYMKTMLVNLINNLP